jgi:hypothetical protein
LFLLSPRASGTAKGSFACAKSSNAVDFCTPTNQRSMLKRVVIDAQTNPRLDPEDRVASYIIVVTVVSIANTNKHLHASHDFS